MCYFLQLMYMFLILIISWLLLLVLVISWFLDLNLERGQTLSLLSGIFWKVIFWIWVIKKLKMLINAVKKSIIMSNSKAKMRFMNWKFFVTLVQQNQLLIFQKMNLLLWIWWICFHLSFCKLQKRMAACILQLCNFYLLVFSIWSLFLFCQKKKKV